MKSIKLEFVPIIRVHREPELRQHALTLVKAGVPEADAVAILSKRKMVGGKEYYSDLGKATVMGPDGKPVTRWGFKYNGKLIPLE